MPVILFQGDSITDAGRNRRLADGVHPTIAGHAAIADRWREAVCL